MDNNETRSITSYNGNEPYIFISYAHKDSETVLPIIEAMQKSGYRIWFDLGIEVGTEWSNNIASHLRDCSMFIAFISQHSVKSENCLDEIAYAKSHQKSALMIFLEEDVTLPEGTEMQTARFQRMYYNRHSSLEGFMESIRNASMLDICRSETDTAEKKDSVKVNIPVKAPAKETKKGNNKLILIVIAVILVAAIAVTSFFIFGGKNGSSTGENNKITLSDDILDCTFELDSVVYKLPFDFSKLDKNGWKISSSDLSKDTEINGKDNEVLYMSKGSSKIEVIVYNNTGNVLPVKDCMVTEIRIDKNCIADFKISKGVTLSSTSKEIIKAFGEPDSYDTESDFEKLTYGEYDYYTNNVIFLFYTEEEYSDYSYITLRSYEFSNKNKTETNEKEPEYLSEYKAPSSLGDDPLSGNIEIENNVYHLPAPIKVFLDNGWEISDRPSHVVAGGEEYITLSRDDATLEVEVKNFASYQTIPENCVVITLSVYDTDNVNAQLPGGLKIGLSAEETASLVPAEMDVEESTYSTYYSYYDYDERDFMVYFSVDAESQTLNYIKLENSIWE